MNHIPNSNNLLLSPTSEIPDIKPITIPKEKLEEILKDLEYKVNMATRRIRRAQTRSKRTRSKRTRIRTKRIRSKKSIRKSLRGG